MNNNSWFKKENPLLSLQSMSGGAAGSLMQGAADKTYLDDVFSTYLYAGTSSAKTVTNGIDFSDEGGMTWIKSRSYTYDHIINDTARGAGKRIKSNTNSTEATSTDWLSAFNSNGFSLGADNDVNNSGQTYSSWSFKKVPGFFDVVAYTGNGTGQTINHSLGCLPGMILIKRLDGSASSWKVYHSSIGKTKYLELNNASAAVDDTSDYVWNDTAPTATTFTLGLHDDVNYNSNTYIAYLFAGGAATQQYSVKTDAGASNYMSVPTHSDLDLDGDFTVEFWHKRSTTGTTHLFSYGNGATTAGIEWYYNGSNVQKLYVNATEYEFPSGTQAPAYKWVHYAISREGTNTRVFVDGIKMTTYTSHSATITGAIITGNQWGGSISASDGAWWSNLRVVKGTAVYTSDFTPPQSALTNITNTKLLCWNSSTTTGATVSPVTIVQNGTVTSKSDTPSYSDPECFKFGEGGDQNIVATGMYTGNGSSTGPEINLGWEPQWILIKSEAVESWVMYDSMRGIYTDGNDGRLFAQDTDAEYSGTNFLDLTSTGWKIVNNAGDFNASDQTISYIAIRRPDGAVSKPVEAGTEVFAMDTSNSSATIPSYDSGFTVDFGVWKRPSNTFDWKNANRLTGNQIMKINTSGAEGGGGSDSYWDSNVGWFADAGQDSSYQSWMWKRGQSFDLINYTGTGAARQIRHGLNAVPEMIWAKKRNSSGNWYVYHKDMNGGVSPVNYFMQLNTYDSQQNIAIWNATPTSTTFHLSTDGHANNSGDDFIAMLFTSVTGISKVGNFTPDSSGSFTVTLGFTPRFIVMKPRNFADNNWGWWVYDSQRGLTSGLTNRLTLESTAAQISGSTNGTTATGISFTGWGDMSAYNWIYYAHA